MVRVRGPFCSALPAQIMTTNTHTHAHACTLTQLDIPKHTFLSVFWTARKYTDDF